jgi:hypothetical protein
MYMLRLLAVVGAAAALSERSEMAVKRDGKFIVDRQTEFSEHRTFLFDNGLPAGLRPSNWPAGNTLYRPENVNVRDGYLELLVNGGQTIGPFTSGEVVTDFNVASASVRTVAILTEPAGVCNGEHSSVRCPRWASKRC